MILSLTHSILGIYKNKVGYENCRAEQNIVQIQRNTYLWLYFVKSYWGRPEKDSFVRIWDSDVHPNGNEEISN